MTIDPALLMLDGIRKQQAREIAALRAALVDAMNALGGSPDGSAAHDRCSKVLAEWTPKP